MGKLFDEFGSLSFNNEAEVSQNFILPLLQNYLGYKSHEILPEYYYKAKDVYSGVKFSEGGTKSLNHRPDYVVCINGDQSDPKFIIDSKGPNEGIDEHLGQLRSYAISVGRNFLLMTNGRELKVYDVNDLLFHSLDIEDLQIKINSLINLLGRGNQALKSHIDILKEFDYKLAITVTDQAKLDLEFRRKRVLIVDFHTYLQKLIIDFTDWNLPTRYFRAIDNLELSKIDPKYLLSFKLHKKEGNSLTERKLFKLSEIERDDSTKIKVFVGETGTGKTSLLKYFTFSDAKSCLDYRETKIPIFISLRQIRQNYKLEDLIVDFLNQNGYKCNSIFDLPKTNDFVFYLDAYDEIAEIFRGEAFMAIEKLSQKYSCYVTSRPNIVPYFKPSTIFDILPISDSQVKEIVRHHVDNRYYEFQRKIENNNLSFEARNILLLLLLISLFKESGSFPDTTHKIIHAIVDRVKKWENSKYKQDQSISWDVIEYFLGVLAYRLFESGESALAKSDAESLLLKILVEMEQLRKVSPGLTLDYIVGVLSKTGLLIANDDHLYFWHRLFLNYFAAFELKCKYPASPFMIQDLLHDERWHIVIVGLASLLPSVTDLVKQTKEDIWLTASCLVENSKCEEEEAQDIIDDLIKQVHSQIPNVRLKAANFLGNINNEQTRLFFFNILNAEFPSDIKMIALSVIGKSRTLEARTTIYRYIDWNESSFLLGPSSQAHIARALYYYDEPEHLQIVENWHKYTDYLMDLECKRIFIELHSQNKLTAKLIKALQQLYISEYQASLHGQQGKLDALANILAFVPDDEFAEKVINLSFNTEDLFKVDSLYEMLKNYTSFNVIEFVKLKVLENADCHYVIERLVEIIVDSTFQVPKEIYFELIDHPNTNVASKAISALKRFPHWEVKEVIDKHLYGDQPQLQSWALGVLVENGEIIRLIRTQLFPNSFYLPAAHTLLKAVRRFHLVEALPLMSRIYNALVRDKNYESDIHLAIELAGTYYFIGEKDKQSEIVSWFFNGTQFIQKNEHLHFNLMKSLKYIDSELAVQVADCYFRTYCPSKDDRHWFKIDVFLETAEELAQRHLVSRIKEIIQFLIDEVKQGDINSAFHLERPMRAMVKLALPIDEDWILDRLDEMKSYNGLEFPQLRRATECLAYIGSAKSLPYIKQVAIQLKHSAMILNVCQFAFEQICFREKISENKGDLFQA